MASIKLLAKAGMLMDLVRLNACIGHPFPAQLLRILFWCGENKVT